MPERIQLRRTKGWRKPPGAVICSRPSKWGNRFVVTENYRGAELPWCVVDHGNSGLLRQVTREYKTREEAVEYAIARFALALKLRLLGIKPEDVRRELAGKDLCCWCRVSDPCHVDVLLKCAAGEPYIDG